MNIPSWEKSAKCEMTREERKAVEEKVSEIITELDLRDMKYRIQQIAYIQDWLNGNVSYDTGYQYSNRTAYSGLIDGSTVCTGYCEIGLEFCKQLNIPCEVFYCEYKDEDIGLVTHVALVVQMENELWYYWDITSINPLDEALLIGTTDSKRHFGNIVKDSPGYTDISKYQIDEQNYFGRYNLDDFITDEEKSILTHERTKVSPEITKSYIQKETSNSLFNKRRFP